MLREGQGRVGPVTLLAVGQQATRQVYPGQTEFPGQTWAGDWEAGSEAFLWLIRDQASPGPSFLIDKTRAPCRSPCLPLSENEHVSRL